MVPVPKAPADPSPGFSHLRDEGYPAGSFSFRGLGSERSVSPADIFRERAPSPFQRHPAARSEPGSLARTELGQVGEQRSLRPHTSDPSAYRIAAGESRPQSMGREPLGMLPKGPPSIPKSFSEQGTCSAPPHEPDFQPIRTVTPVKPRVTYPLSLGGTEIKPPPTQRSPKKPRTVSSPTPSPTRPKTSESPNPKAPLPEPQNDLQQLTAVLEGVFRATRSEDNKVEDVKTIPELPKLEIKDHEKELTPLIAGDWLTVIGPSLRDLSAQASQW